MASLARLYRFGPYELDQDRSELRKFGTRLKLERKPLQLLTILVDRSGEVVTRSDLRALLWGEGVFVDFDKGLSVVVAKLRAALNDSSESPTYFETVAGQGYRFIADVERVCAGAQVSAPAQTDTEQPVSASSQSPSGPGYQPGSVGSDLISPTARWSWWQARRTTPAFPYAHRRVVGGIGVALLALLTVGYVIARIRAGDVRQPKIKSLAVLPLKNLSGDPAQEYLADGMTEAVIGRLSSIRDLRVISRTSVLRFKDTQLSVPEIARTLRVDAIVEGSVIREGNRIRVYAELIRAATDDHFWSETYDRELQDVLALQSDVAQSIATKVEVTITGEERERLTTVRSVSPEVYEDYLKGEFGSTNTRADVEQSIAYYEQAIAKDPRFAPAYAGLASAYDQLADLLVGAPPDEVLPKETSAARKALELDPGLATPHVLLADVYQQEWQWAEAEVEYKRALELNPNDAVAYLGFANWLLCHGRMEEALTWSERARELDPVGATGLSNGWILFNARRYNDAIRELRSVIAIHPDYATAHWFLGFALIASGQSDEGIMALKKAASLSGGSPAAKGTLVRAYAQAGHRKEARKLVDELRRRQQEGYVPAAAFVDAYLGLGDNDQAFAWLDRAYQEHSGILQVIKVDPLFDPLRGDPRFADLVRRVGLN